MEGVTNPKISKTIDEGNNTAVFEIKPCYPGYGITLGNALRRVLISSLPGAAITSIKLKGVSHEFSTISGVLEDVAQISLNLKQVIVKMDTEEKVSASIKVSGEKEITAADIKVPSNVEIVNKDLHIATITDKKAEIDMTLTIEKGIGYVPTEKAKDTDSPIGTIVIDALFSPVIKVNYEVKNIRVGQTTNYNQINLEIQTDGTVTPEESLNYASNILINQFKSIIGDENILALDDNIGAESAKQEAEAEFDEDANNPDALKISELELSKRTLGVLEESNIKTVNKLASKSKKYVSELSGMGAKGVEEIVKALNNIGLSLKE